jgi:hypothetical protein
MGLLRKQKSSIHSRTKLAARKKLEEVWDHLPPHENNLIERTDPCNEMIERTDPCNDMHSILSRGKETDSFVNERSIKVTGSSYYPVNTTCEMVRYAVGAKDDIFGDLPLLESSKVIFQTGGDELPTVIEESFITDQSDLDAESETVSLKLINDYNITAQTSLDDLVKIEEAPDKEPICISYNDAASCAVTTGIDCLPNCKSISTAKTHGDVTTLSFYPDLRSKCGSNNPPHCSFDTNTNCSQGIDKHGTSSVATLPVVRTRTKATNYKDALVIPKKSTDVPAPVVTSNNLLLYQGNVLPYAISQGVIGSRTTKNYLPSQGSVLPSAVSRARAYGNDMTSCTSMPTSTSSTNPPTMRTGAEPTNYKDVPAIFKKSIDFSGPLVASKNHFSHQSSFLSPTVSQRVDSARINADEMNSCRSTPD